MKRGWLQTDGRQGDLLFRLIPYHLEGALTSVGAGLRSDQESNIRIGITFINWFVSLLGLLDNTSVSVISLTALRDKARIQLSTRTKGTRNDRQRCGIVSFCRSTQSARLLWARLPSWEVMGNIDPGSWLRGSRRWVEAKKGEVSMRRRSGSMGRSLSEEPLLFSACTCVGCMHPRVMITGGSVVWGPKPGPEGRALSPGFELSCWDGRWSLGNPPQPGFPCCGMGIAWCAARLKWLGDSRWKLKSQQVLSFIMNFHKSFFFSWLSTGISFSYLFMNV